MRGNDGSARAYYYSAMPVQPDVDLRSPRALPYDVGRNQGLGSFKPSSTRPVERVDDVDLLTSQAQHTLISAVAIGWLVLEFRERLDVLAGCWADEEKGLSHWTIVSPNRAEGCFKKWPLTPSGDCAKM
jgi:hypothetical protein